MTAQSDHLRIGEWTLHIPSNRLARGAEEYRLEPRLTKLLAYLARAQGQVISRETLVAQIWEDQYVTNEAVSVAVYELRKALGDNARSPMYIKTIRKGGFQMVARVEAVEDDPVVEPEPQVEPVPEVEPEPMADHPEPEVAKKKNRLMWWLVPACFLVLLVWWMFPRTTTFANPERKALAILPFDFMSEDQEQAYFAEGMTEALINDLARSTRVRVLPRRSVLRYNGSTLSPVDIGKDLGVDLLVEGAVQSFDGKVKVTVGIIEAATENHLWTRDYQKPVQQFFDIQKEVSFDLIGYLTGSSDTSRPEVGDQLPADMYHGYLKGRYFLNKGTAHAARKAVPYFNLVVRHAPEFAPAHAGLATCYTLYGAEMNQTRGEIRRLARFNVDKGLELDDSIAELHIANGILRFLYEWQMDRADASFRKALELHPTSVPAHQWLALLMSARGHHKQALALIESAAFLAPLSVDVFYTRARVALLAGDYANARTWLEKTVELEPNHGDAQLNLFLVKRLLEEHGEFFADLNDWSKTLDESPRIQTDLGGLVNSRSLRPNRRASWLRKRQQRERISPVVMAQFCIQAGDPEEAISWLRQAGGERHEDMVFLAVHPLLESLRQDPRIQELIEQIGTTQP